MHINKLSIILFFSIVFIIFSIIIFNFKLDSKNYSAGFMPLETVKAQDLKEKYNNDIINILIVPGHDNKDFGTSYRGLREADLNLLVAKRLYKVLNSDEHFNVTVTRDFDTGKYNKEFLTYFENKKDILSFIKKVRQEMQLKLAQNKIQKIENPSHSIATSRIVKKLYGINKWSNENNIDVVLHIHFNNYERPNYTKVPGFFRGFAIYIPEKQFSASKSSYKIAKSISAQLNNDFLQSNNPQEKQGVIFDQDLIAIGSNGSLNAASLVIEAGYIYENQFFNLNLRGNTINKFVNNIYNGLNDFFSNNLSKEEKMKKDIDYLRNQIQYILEELKKLQTKYNSENVYN